MCRLPETNRDCSPTFPGTKGRKAVHIFIFHLRECFSSEAAVLVISVIRPGHGLNIIMSCKLGSKKKKKKSVDIKDLLVLTWQGCFSSLAPWHLGFTSNLALNVFGWSWVHGPEVYASCQGP